MTPELAGLVRLLAEFAVEQYFADGSVGRTTGFDSPPVPKPDTEAKPAAPRPPGDTGGRMS